MYPTHGFGRRRFESGGPVMLAERDPPPVAIRDDLQIIDGDFDRARSIQALMSLFLPITAGQAWGRLETSGVEREVGWDIFSRPRGSPIGGRPLQLNQSGGLPVIGRLFSSTLGCLLCCLLSWFRCSRTCHWRDGWSRGSRGGRCDCEWWSRRRRGLGYARIGRGCWSGWCWRRWCGRRWGRRWG